MWIFSLPHVLLCLYVPFHLFPLWNGQKLFFFEKSKTETTETDLIWTICNFQRLSHQILLKTAIPLNIEQFSEFPSTKNTQSITLLSYSCLLSYPLSPFSPFSSSSSPKKSSSSPFSHFSSLPEAAVSKSYSTTRYEWTRTNDTLKSKQFAKINKNKRFFIFADRPNTSIEWKKRNSMQTFQWFDFNWIDWCLSISIYSRLNIHSCWLQYLKITVWLWSNLKEAKKTENFPINWLYLFHCYWNVILYSTIVQIVDRKFTRRAFAAQHSPANHNKIDAQQLSRSTQRWNNCNLTRTWQKQSKSTHDTHSHTESNNNWTC